MHVLGKFLRIEHLQPQRTLSEVRIFNKKRSQFVAVFQKCCQIPKEMTHSFCFRVSSRKRSKHCFGSISSRSNVLNLCCPVQPGFCHIQTRKKQKNDFDASTRVFQPKLANDDRLKDFDERKNDTKRNIPDLYEIFAREDANVALIRGARLNVASTRSVGLILSKEN